MKGYLRKHYHWVIALVVLLEMFAYVGILNNINGLYLIPVTGELGISRGDYSLAFSAKALVGALSVVVSGPLLRRFGYRKMAALFLGVAAAAFLVLSVSRNLFMLYLGVTMIGICEGSCLTASAAFIIGKWFRKYHGSVLGFVTAATGIGGSATCILLTGIINGAGWRQSYVVCGILTAAVGVLIALLIRDEPERLGLRPFGEGERIRIKEKQRKGTERWHGFTLTQLTRMPVFYLTVLEIFLSCLCLYIAFYVIVPYLQSRGFTPEEAASMQSVMLLGMAAFKLLSGVLSDWIGAKSAVGLCLAATTVSFYLLIRADSVASGILAVVVFALALPMTTVAIPLLTASLFGYRAHNTTNGFFLALPAAAAMIASPLTNTVFDRTGSYIPAFRGAFLLSVLVLFLHFPVCLLAKRERKRLEQAGAEAVSDKIS